MTKHLSPLLLLFIAAAGSSAGAEFPQWAYTVAAPPKPPKSPQEAIEPRHVPHSIAAYTRSQIEGSGPRVVDWHPQDHGPMPDIVARIRPPEGVACALCHLPNGAGFPQNASLAGLSVGYIKQQVANFRAGLRLGSAPQRPQQGHMIAVANVATDVEVERAAVYFASLPGVSFATVAESDTAPAATGGREPLGRRIIELPLDLERYRSADPRTPWVAYVPNGSLARGEILVTTGGGKTLGCATCHGPDLKGLADIPRLAGRSPSYLMRQLYDMKTGTRAGPLTILMQPVLAGLDTDDLLAIAAFLASQKP